MAPGSKARGDACSAADDPCRSVSRDVLPEFSARTASGRDPPRRCAKANVRLDISIAQSRHSALGQSLPLCAQLSRSAEDRGVSEADIEATGKHGAKEDIVV